MKKLFLFTMLLSILFYSCTNESLIEERNLIEQQDLKLDAKSSSTTNSFAPPGCSLDAADCAAKNDLLTYTFTSSSSSQIVWSVISGDITINSGQGTNTATFLFGSNFTGGRITVGAGSCSIEQIISLCGALPCPTTSCLQITQVDIICTDFLVNLNCATDVTRVDWSYSMGPYNDVPFGTTFNPNGSYNIDKPLYLPEGNWDFYYLWVHADITLSDSSTCTVSNSLLIDCVE